MAKRYGSEVLASVHETALGMTEADVMSRQTMKAFDEMCLTPVEGMAPDDIRAHRLRENASQAVFARYLNMTTGLVSQREGPHVVQAGKMPALPGGLAQMLTHCKDNVGSGRPAT